jgi:sec-independent protein translocase protein TatA
MGFEAPWHWVVLVIVVVALFGYKKLPDAARSLGRSLRIFKTEIKGMSQDDADREKKAIESTTPTEPAAGSEAPPPADAEVPASTAKNESTNSAD